MKFHRIFLILVVVAGLPIALLAALLMVPAFLDSPCAALLLAVPTVLVVWAVVLVFRTGPDPDASLPIRKHLLVFYAVTGFVSAWASTWTFTRDGHSGRIFIPSTTVVVAVIFLIPIVDLLIARTQVRRNTEQEPETYTDEPRRSG